MSEWKALTPEEKGLLRQMGKDPAWYMVNRPGSFLIFRNTRNHNDETIIRLEEKKK